MAEYIEREALLWEWKTSPKYKCHVASLAQCIHDAPVADVVEVVRRGECEYYQDNNGGYPHPECRWNPDETPDADDFCSYGRRREDSE